MLCVTFLVSAFPRNGEAAYVKPNSHLAITGANSLVECVGDHAQTEVATHYFWIADYTSM